jgi:hypothetical protein
MGANAAGFVRENFDIRSRTQILEQVYDLVLQTAAAETASA